MYDDSPIVDNDEPPQGGAKEAYLDPMPTRSGNAPSTARSTQGDDPRPPQVVREGASRDRGPQGGHYQRQQDASHDPPTRLGVPPAQRISGSRQVRFADQPEVPEHRDAEPELRVPERRAAIVSPQEMTDAEQDFLKTALEMNLPMVMQQRNPKRAQSASRHRD